MATENINTESAFLHVLGDMIMSVGVVIAATVIYFVPEWDFIDPICTYVFSVIVVFTTVPVMKDCVHVLMEGTPSIVDSEQLLEDLEKADGVEEIHDFHVWSISVGKLSLTCHIKSDRPTDSLNAVTNICREKYGITHTTVQVEGHTDNLMTKPCENDLH
jgi:zinc transporter 2